MAIDEKTVKAWGACSFCGRPDEEIAGIILDGTRWKELPLGYKCAWKRISQVAFRRQLQMRKGLWRDMCAARADWNNSPGADWEQSDWTEDWCAVYKELNPVI